MTENTVYIVLAMVGNTQFGTVAKRIMEVFDEKGKAIAYVAAKYSVEPTENAIKKETEKRTTEPGARRLVYWIEGHRLY